MSVAKVDVLFDMRECAAILGAAKQEPAALRLLDGHDAVAELIKAAESVQRQVAPLLSSNGYGYVGAMESLRKALARVDGAA